MEHALRLQELFDPDSVLRVDVRLLVENIIASAYGAVVEGETVTVSEFASHKEETEVLEELVSVSTLESIKVFVDQPFAVEGGDSKRDLDVIQAAQCLVANAACAAKEFMSKSYKYIVHPIETSLEAVAKEIVNSSVSWAKKNFHYYSSSASVKKMAIDLVNAMKSSEALPMRISLFYEPEYEGDVSGSSESQLSLSPVRTLSIVGDYEEELQESAKDLVEDVVLSAKNSLERLQNNAEMALAAG